MKKSLLALLIMTLTACSGSGSQGSSADENTEDRLPDNDSDPMLEVDLTALREQPADLADFEQAARMAVVVGFHVSAEDDKVFSGIRYRRYADVDGTSMDECPDGGMRTNDQHGDIVDVVAENCREVGFFGLEKIVDGTYWHECDIYFDGDNDECASGDVHWDQTRLRRVFPERVDSSEPPLFDILEQRIGRYRYQGDHRIRLDLRMDFTGEIEGQQIAGTVLFDTLSQVYFGSSEGLYGRVGFASSGMEHGPAGSVESHSEGRTPFVDFVSVEDDGPVRLRLTHGALTLRNDLGQEAEVRFDDDGEALVTIDGVTQPIAAEVLDETCGGMLELFVSE